MLRAFFDYVVIRFQICIFDILNTAMTLRLYIQH